MEKFKKIENVFEKICKGLSVIGTVALVAMMLVVFIDVFSRTIIRHTFILGTTEYAQICLLCMMTAVPLVTLKNQNTMVDVFIGKFPRPVRRIINLLTVLATAIILALLGWQMMKSGNYAASHRVRYTMNRFPQSYVYYMYGISAFFMSLASLFVMVREWIMGSREWEEAHPAQVDQAEEEVEVNG